MYKPLQLLFFICFSFSCFAQQAEPTIEIKEIPMDPRVKMGKLKNGLTYYIRKNNEPQKRAQLYLVIKAGSLQENDDQKGLAHFTEHMAFNGTKNFPKKELIDYLQKAGVKFGADLNAYTSYSETVFELPLPTDDAELFESGFKILSEWAGNISFNQEEINSERGVIAAEERQRGKDVSERISQQLLPVLLGNSRYEDRSPIGDMEIVKNFKPETLKEFYKDWYRPELQAVIAVGDFDEAKVEALIKKNFSGLSASGGKPERLEYDIPSNEEPLVKIVTDPEFPYTIASVIYKHPSGPATTTQDLRHSVIRNAVSVMLSRRISEKIQSGTSDYLSAEVNYGPYQGGIANLDAFSLQVAAKSPEELKVAIEGIMDDVQSMRQFGFTQGEFDRVKKDIMTSVIQNHREKDKTSSMGYMNQLVQHFIKGEPVISIDYLLDFYNSNLPTITLEEVNQIGKNFVSEKNQIVLVQASEESKDLMPNEKTLLHWVNSVREVEAYEDDFLGGDIINEDLEGSDIVKRKEHSSIEITEIELSNGVKITLKPTDFRNDQILFSSFSPGGYSLAPEDEINSSKMAVNIISSSGIGDYTSNQFNKLLAGKSLTLSPYISPYFEGLSGSATSEDLETALKLVYLYFTQPRKDSIPFNRIIENTRISIEGKSSNPIAVFQDTVNAAMMGNSPWVAPLTLETLDKVSLEKAYEFYRDRYSDASDFTFTFVGNFEIPTILPLLQKYLGSLPSIKRTENYKDVGIRSHSGHITKIVKRGLEDKAFVALSFHDEYVYNRQNNMHLNMLKSSLEEKLLKRLREKESGVYSPSVGLSSTRIPSPYYTFSISFSCAPDMVDHLIEATLEELELLKKQGPTQDELEKYIAHEKRQKETQLRSNGFWLSFIQNVYHGNLEMDYIDSYDDYLNELNLQELQKAAQKFLNPENSAKFILLPENVN